VESEKLHATTKSMYEISFGHKYCIPSHQGTPLCPCTGLSHAVPDMPTKLLSSHGGSKDLTVLLLPCVDSKREARVDAGMEVGHVVIQIRLADLGIGVEDVHD
jgi:hypothetical protein